MTCDYLCGLPFIMHGGIFFSRLPMTVADDARLPRVVVELLGQLRGDVAGPDAAADKRGVGLDLPEGTIAKQVRVAGRAVGA